MTTPNSDAKQTYLTTSQAAERMGVTVETVRQLCTQQRLEGSYQKHENDAWRIPTQSVETWLQQQSQTASTIFDQSEQQLNQQTNVAGNLNTGGGLANAGQIHANDIVGRDQITHIHQYIDPTDKTNQKNHSVLRQAVHIFWVQGVLHHSLYNEVRIRLGLSQRTDAVDYPWYLIWQQNNSPDTPINEQTQLFDIYNQMGERMLILGEPGAGKTTMLLMLTEALLQRAKDNPTLPTPVIFNLTSWAEGQPLDEWLVEQLNQRYQIPKKISQGWIERNELILLLDDLDEVAENRRNACVTAINDFQRQHVVSIVVCSRTVEYESLTDKLQLHGTVVVSPLTQSQIDTYILDLGIEGVNLKLALDNSDELRQLINTPLMLSVMTLAYQDNQPQDNQPQTKDVNRSQIETLFDTYIRRMLQHRESEQPSQYTHKQILHWLQRLASQMVEHKQALFLIEWLQPNWLGSASQVNWFRRGIGLSIGLSIGLIVGLFFGLIGELIGGLIFNLIFGLIYGLFFGLIVELSIGLSIGLFFGSIGGLSIGLIGLKSWQEMKDSWKDGLIDGLNIGLNVGLIFGLIRGVILLYGGLSLGLIGGLSLGLSLGLGIRLSKESRMTEATLKIQMNRGVWRVLKNRLNIGLGIGLFFGLIGGLTFGLHFGLIGGLIGGLIFGLIFGLDTCLKHLILQLLLYHQKQINYVHFLDYATTRLFLRKVGGGYVFIHRMIMEHIAALTDEDIERIVKSVKGR